MALAALLAARTAAPAPCAPAALPLRALFSHRSARCWIAAELVAYGAWTAVLTFVGASFVERLSLREPMVGWILAGGAAAYSPLRRAAQRSVPAASPAARRRGLAAHGRALSSSSSEQPRRWASRSAPSCCWGWPAAFERLPRAGLRSISSRSIGRHGPLRLARDSGRRSARGGEFAHRSGPAWIKVCGRVMLPLTGGRAGSADRAGLSGALRRLP
jgi:hypothetical protein